MSRYLLPLGLFLAIAVFLARGLTLDPKEVPSPLIGKPAPAFVAPSLAEPTRTIRRDDLVGKVWMLNVWASWCAACRQEHPVIVELSRRGIVPIYGLNYKDQRTDGLAWLREVGDPYTESVHDLDGRVGLDWGVYGVPETFIVDRTGTVRFKHVGPLTRELVAGTIEPLLRQLQ